MKRDDKLFLRDILDAIFKIQEFVEGMDFAGFVQDDRTSSAVVRKIEIIGEATKNVPGAIRQRYRRLPWTDMAKMRDKVIHFYFGIDHEIVWKVIKERLPQIQPQISQILKDLEDSETKT